MKIIELRAENVKRLTAVDITPDGTLQVVGGRNAQGKSSVLDAIWLALGGKKASRDTAQPIREGQDKASVTLDLGELVVTRTWTHSSSKLTVQSADGATFKSPQTMLDNLVGQLSFDPLAFTRQSPREQRDALIDLVDLDVDLDALDHERQQAYDQRTQVGRDGKAIGDVTVDDSLPDEEQSASQIVAELQAAQETNREIVEAQRTREARAEEIQRLEKRIYECQNEIAEAQRAADRTPYDTADISGRLEAVEETNAAIRANSHARQRAAQRDELREAYADLTAKIEGLDKQKADALAAADFPVDGLAFDEHGVTYNGVPFSQASTAEQIRVSLAMAMALNPKLRVLRIMDGSLLDDEAMNAIRESVEENDFQLWIERVGSADEGAVIIEDGEAA